MSWRKVLKNQAVPELPIFLSLKWHL